MKIFITNLIWPIRDIKQLNNELILPFTNIKQLYIMNESYLLQILNNHIFN